MGPARVTRENATRQPRPAFYALSPGGWRDYATLLHPPYTLWHLSYVAIGSALAPELRVERLAWLLAAFFLAMGIGAHALDELEGRPLRTRIPDRVLVGLAAASTAGAVAIGVAAALAWTLWLVPFVAVGPFLVVSYNLELFRGRLHGPVCFALFWGAFPVVTAYFATAERLRVEALLGAAFAFLTSLVQQQLSTPVRKLRRRVTSVSGSLELTDGSREAITAETLGQPPERALQTLSGAMVALAATLVAARLA